MAPDVAVVGAGAIGCSAAFHLAREGLDVVVLERRAEPGLGSTRCAPAGFRHLFSTEINVRLSLESLAWLDRVEEETGAPFRFERRGYLLVTADEDEAAALRERTELQRRLGVRVEEPRVEELWPDARVDDLAGAAFCPDDGTGDALELTRALAAGARAHGAEFRFGVDVTSLDELDAGQVVLAAGAASARLAELPIAPSRRRLWRTAPHPAADEPRPFLVDLDTSLVCVPRGGAFVFGCPGRAVQPGLAGVREAAARRVPWLPEARESWEGEYELTPDAHPVVDRLSERVVVAAGFSGHGVMHAPAAGRIVADLVAGRDPGPIEALAAGRFAAGSRTETLVF